MLFAERTLIMQKGQHIQHLTEIGNSEGGGKGKSDKVNKTVFDRMNWFTEGVNALADPFKWDHLEDDTPGFTNVKGAATEMLALQVVNCSSFPLS